MKVIVDTNVLISAVLKGRKPRDVIQLISDRSDVDWIVSSEVLAEYRQVINRGKFKLSEDVRVQWLNKIDQITQLVEVEMKVDFPRDPKDAKFIALAIAIEADFLITGDRDFNQVTDIGQTTIISVSSFQELLLNEQ